MPRSTGGQKNGNNQVLETRESELHQQKGDILPEQLDFEIECPRCKDIMELFSEFDYLSYYCDGCHLELTVH